MVTVAGFLPSTVLDTLSASGLGESSQTLRMLRLLFSPLADLQNETLCNNTKLWELQGVYGNGIPSFILLYKLYPILHAEYKGRSVYVPEASKISEPASAISELLTFSPTSKSLKHCYGRYFTKRNKLNSKARSTTSYWTS